MAEQSEGVGRRISKVWADERRRLCGTRKAAPEKAPPKRRAAADADDRYEDDIAAINELVSAVEAARPAVSDAGYELISRTWERRHGETRTTPDNDLEKWFRMHPYMSCWRMVHE